MKRLVLLMLLLLTARGFAQPFPEPVIPENFGINIHFTDPKPGEAEMLAAGGFRWVRMDMLWNQSWSATERTRGVYDFSKYDRLLAALEPHHPRVIFILAYGNPLYDGGLSPHSDEGRAAFAAWAVAAAQHFAGRGILWEIWNEPNGRLFWKPAPKADDYAQLALAVGKAFREKVPQERCIGPALAKFDWPFLETLFQAGVLEYWSAVTVHPYREAPPETAASDYRRLRRLIAQYAPAGKTIPILSGEWGYSTLATSLNTPELQAKYLLRQWLTNFACEIPVSIWYDWHDDGQNPKELEHHFGTVEFAYHAGADPVYTPKPSYRAAQTLTSTLRGYRLNKRLALASPDDCLLLLEQQGQLKLVAWTAAAPHEVTIPASDGPFTGLSLLNGNSEPPLTARGGSLTLPLTDTPACWSPAAANETLQLAAAWQKLPVDVSAAGVSTLTLRTALKNPTGHAIRVRGSSGPMQEIAAGQTAEFTWPVPVLRSPSNTPLRLELLLDTGGVLAQEVGLLVANPLVPTLLPAGERAVRLRIDNPSGQALAGSATLAVHGQAALTPVPLTFAAGQRSATVTFATQAALPPAATLKFTCRAPDGTLQAQSTFAYSSVPADGLAAGGYALWPTQHQSLTAADAPEPPPTRRGPVLKLDYRFLAPPAPATRPAPQAAAAATTPAAASQAASQAATSAASQAASQVPSQLASQPATQASTQLAATKPAEPLLTLSLCPKPQQTALTAIPGQPTALRLWVYGDGSGNPLSARFRDATGAIFQPPAEPITWHGWRAVSFPLDDPSVWHWGGSKEDRIHYPIEWHTLFLMDAAGKKSGQGTIYLTTPTILWETPP